MMKRHVAACMIAGLALLGGAGFASASGMDHFGLWDAPSSFFPGAYFESKAQFYLKKKDYAFALVMFKQAGWWANRRGQYNAGVMLFNGIGVPADKILGTAWLQIAAGPHDDLAQQTLHQAEATLNPEQRAQVDIAFQSLKQTYGDAVTLPRALNRYATDRGQMTGSHTGHSIGPLAVYGGDGSWRSGVDYYGDKNKELQRLVDHITGTVSVGAVEPLPYVEPKDKAADSPKH